MLAQNARQQESSNACLSVLKETDVLAVNATKIENVPGAPLHDGGVWLSRTGGACNPGILRRGRGRLLRALSLSLLTGAGLAGAQTYPIKPVTLIIPFAAGSTSDVIARLFAPPMQELLGQPLIIDNRPGAAGTIGTAAVARAPADGYTLMLTSPGHAAAKSLYRGITWDPVKSFAPVILAGAIPNVIAVKSSSPFKTIGEFVSYVKAHPGKENYAHTGIGTSPHLMTELFKQQTGMDLQQIPYKGSGEVVNALIAGDVAMAPLGLLIAAPQVEAGVLRVLAVSAQTRSTVMPTVPTLKESGFPDVDARPWQGIFAPAGTPRPIVEKLNAAFAKAMNYPDVKSRLVMLGMQLDLGSPEEMGRFIQEDVERWTRVIRQGGIRVE
ncbi:tripartite tricarboxylate transporter substrate binding protein [Xylophilus sp. GW821-FHT01B05]